MTVEREVGHRRIAAGEARTAVIRRRYDAPIEDVWDACTNPERMRRWFLLASGDLRPGGSFSLKGNASGEILRCEPPRLLKVTWAYGSRPVDEVELRLSPDGDGTLFELEHATVSTEVEYEGQLVDVIPGMGVGWDLTVFALDRFLRGEMPADYNPEKFETTPEIDALIERSTKAWEARLGPPAP
jgi:uncharacterized protein YndB with AHSA1/START domain